MVYDVAHYINGQKYIEKNDKTQAIYNPAQGVPIGNVFLANKALCDKAVHYADLAFTQWSLVTPVKRARILFNFRALIERYTPELAQAVVRENGKTIEDAKGSIARAIEVIEWHCGLLGQMQGTFSANVSSGMDCYTIRTPLGVCVGVSPFNFPVMVPIWMMIPSIACGNTFILKPSEQDPSASLLLAEWFSEAGLPQGVFQCVQGNQETVAYLIEHPRVQAVAAVASTPVALSIYQKAAHLGKRVHTFGGAKNHAVVMPDADLSYAAEAIAGAAFGSAGQRCMALSVIVAVGDETANALSAQLKPLIEKIRIDAGDRPHTDMGPLINKQHRENVLARINEGIEAGATLVIDGRAFKHPDYPNGFFIGPTLFDHVAPSMSIYSEEIFGPVLVMLRVSSMDEALHLINSNRYGNGAAIFTRDGFSAREFSSQVAVGMVGVNVPIPVPIVSHPFGGIKASHFGESGKHGMDSVHFYTHFKSITVKWPETKERHDAFIMPVNH